MTANASKQFVAVCVFLLFLPGYSLCNLLVTKACSKLTAAHISPVLVTATVFTEMSLTLLAYQWLK